MSFSLIVGIEVRVRASGKNRDVVRFDRVTGEKLTVVDKTFDISIAATDQYGGEKTLQVPSLSEDEQFLCDEDLLTSPEKSRDDGWDLWWTGHEGLRSWHINRITSRVDEFFSSVFKTEYRRHEEYNRKGDQLGFIELTRSSDPEVAGSQKPWVYMNYALGYKQEVKGRNGVTPRNSATFAHTNIQECRKKFETLWEKYAGVPVQTSIIVTTGKS